jgi:hypothetical protein
MKERITVWAFVFITIFGSATIATTAWKFGEATQSLKEANQHIARIEMEGRCESAHRDRLLVLLLNRISHNLGTPQVAKLPEVAPECE